MQKMSLIELGPTIIFGRNEEIIRYLRTKGLVPSPAHGKNIASSYIIIIMIDSRLIDCHIKQM